MAFHITPEKKRDFLGLNEFRTKMILDKFHLIDILMVSLSQIGNGKDQIRMI